MAIQMRRGFKADFNPAKLLPGEWAVAIDSNTQNQIVWMCFAAGIVKRMGTYEDFKQQILEATEEIKEEYKADFSAILEQIEELARQVSIDVDTVVIIKSNIENVYLPQILTNTENTKKWAVNAADSAVIAEKKAVSAESSAIEAESYAHGGTHLRENEDVDNAKYYCEKSQNSSEISKAYASKTEQAGNEAVKKIKSALDIDAPEFVVDLSTGHLMYEGGRFVFELNNAGHLEWGLAV